MTLPPLPEEQAALPVEIDGSPVELAAGAGTLRLAGLGLSEGNHLVHIGSVNKRYATVRTLHNVTPPVESPVGHELRLANGGLYPTSLDAVKGAEAHEKGARVCGSLVELGAAVPASEGRPPLILPRGAQRRVLVSDQPGVLEEVEVPEEPRWMRRAGLECQSFEYVPRIEARWLVTEWRMRGRRVRRIEGEPRAFDAGEGERQEIPAWVEIVLACDLDCVEPGNREDWQRLRDRAASIGT